MSLLPLIIVATWKYWLETNLWIVYVLQSAWWEIQSSSQSPCKKVYYNLQYSYSWKSFLYTFVIFIKKIYILSKLYKTFFKHITCSSVTLVIETNWELFSLFLLVFKVLRNTYCFTLQIWDTYKHLFKFTKGGKYYWIEEIWHQSYLPWYLFSSLHALVPACFPQLIDLRDALENVDS